VLELDQKIMTNETRLTPHAVDFLKDWLGEEIPDVDRKFAAFLKDKGVGQRN